MPERPGLQVRSVPLVESSSGRDLPDQALRNRHDKPHARLRRFARTFGKGSKSVIITANGGLS
jgi:hypothetical protein